MNQTVRFVKACGKFDIDLWGPTKPHRSSDQDTIIMMRAPPVALRTGLSSFYWTHLHAICTKLTKTTCAGIARARAPLSAIYICFILLFSDKGDLTSRIRGQQGQSSKV